MLIVTYILNDFNLGCLSLLLFPWPLRLGLTCASETGPGTIEMHEMLSFDI